MMISDKNFLDVFGWDDFYAQSLTQENPNSWMPARVICEERNIFQVQYGLDEIVWASISGKMQFSAKIRADYPAVGDWVMIELRAGSDRAAIHQIAARKSTIYRKQIGASTDAQILSTNVDYVFITTSVSEDLNQRRLERYLSIAWDSGTSPIILLTKADIIPEEIDEIEADVQLCFPSTPIHRLSKLEFAKADFFTRYLTQGKTAVFVGSSGVGKSTIVNYLTGKDKIKTQEVRERDGRGRHTTTSRNLYVSRFGGLIIDTPGMRELALTDHVEGLAAQFDDVVGLFSACKFGDCKHQAEPGCAVKAALESGSLERERWESYQKLEAEIQHGKRKQDKTLAAEDRKKWKKITVDARDRGRAKKTPK